MCLAPWSGYRGINKMFEGPPRKSLGTITSTEVMASRVTEET